VKLLVGLKSGLIEESCNDSYAPGPIIIKLAIADNIYLEFHLQFQ
jgi:hypothetical protein